MLPTIVVRMGTDSQAIGRRTRGSITGSRLASALVRAPVILAMRHTITKCPSHLWTDGTTKFGLGSYVDNLYGMGSSPTSVAVILSTVARYLRDAWSLELKESSRQILLPLGNPCHEVGEIILHGGFRWPLVSSMFVLGHYIQGNAKTDESWTATRDMCWRKCWRKCWPSQAFGVREKKRLQILNSAVSSVLLPRTTAWPFEKKRAESIMKMQRRMLGLVCAAPYHSRHTAEENMRLRGRHVNKLMAEHTTIWAKKWAENIVNWNQHVGRQLQQGYRGFWSPHLRSFVSSEWLMRRRLDSGGTSTCGRTGTRMYACRYVPERWQDSVRDAQEYI